MHNRIGFNRLGRKSSHLRALHRNMVTSLIKHERIRTTGAKAKEIRRTAEKLVTRAKVDSVHNRRIAARTIFEKEAVYKLFTEIGPRFVNRPGGYTRILKLGRRSGDAAEMVILEFLGKESADTARLESESPASAEELSGSETPARPEGSEKPEELEEKADSAE